MPTCSLGQPALKTSCFQKSTCRKWVKTEVKGQKRSFFQNVQIWLCGISKVAYQREDYHGVLIFSLNWMVLEISHPIWFGHASRNTPLLPIFACFSVIFLCNIGLFVLKIISEHVRILRCNGIFLFMHQAFLKSVLNVFYCACVTYWLFPLRFQSFSYVT